MAAGTQARHERRDGDIGSLPLHKTAQNAGRVRSFLRLTRAFGNSPSTARGYFPRLSDPATQKAAFRTLLTPFGKTIDAVLRSRFIGVRSAGTKSRHSVNRRYFSYSAFRG